MLAFHSLYRIEFFIIDGKVRKRNIRDTLVLITVKLPFTLLYQYGSLLLLFTDDKVVFKYMLEYSSTVMVKLPFTLLLSIWFTVLLLLLLLPSALFLVVRDKHVRV